MLYRTLGRTGLRVSSLGFGGIPIQRLDTPEAVRVIHAAVDTGINFFDTARAYTDSEIKLGLALSGKRDKVLIASKTLARTAEAMAADIAVSLRNLQTDVIDLYQMHNVKDQTTATAVLGPGGALEALRQARNRGVIRYIGVTGHRPEILSILLQTGEFDTVMFPYNPVETEAELLIKACTDGNVGSIVMKPLAGGALHPTGAALKWALKRPVSVVIPGMDSEEIVRENTAVAAAPEFLPGEEETLLTAAARLGDGFCRKCDYCQPCPAGIDIAMTFILDGYFTRYGLPAWSRQRYQAMAKHVDDCLDCGACESICPYALPIRAMLREAHTRLGA